MIDRRPRFPRCTLYAVVALLGTGCGGLDSAAGLWDYGPDEALLRQEQQLRERYQSERDPAAMKWLLRHRIRQGMSLTEVNNVFGEAGNRVYDDERFKNNGGIYRRGDRVYKWGPDSQGHSIYLVFRDERLVNFDPEEFAEPTL